MRICRNSALNSLIAISTAGLVLTACGSDDTRSTNGTGGTGATGATGTTGGTEAGTTGGTNPGTAGTGTGGGDTTGGLCTGISTVLSPDLPGDEVVDDFEADTHVFISTFTAEPTSDDLAENPDAVKPTLSLEIVEGTQPPGEGPSILHVSSDTPLYFWGGGFLTFFNCTDVSAFTGLSFWAKGTTATGKMNVGTDMKEATAGSCEPDACTKHPTKAVTLSEEWTPYKIPFEAFQSDAPGLEYYGSIVGVRFMFPGGAEVDVYLDDVEFYKE